MARFVLERASIVFDIDLACRHSDRRETDTAARDRPQPCRSRAANSVSRAGDGPSDRRGEDRGNACATAGEDCRRAGRVVATFRLAPLAQRVSSPSLRSLAQRPTEARSLRSPIRPAEAQRPTEARSLRSPIRPAEARTARSMIGSAEPRSGPQKLSGPQKQDPRGQRWVKFGARFSRKADMPSFWSAVSNSAANACFSCTRPSASDVSIAASRAAFAA